MSNPSQGSSKNASTNIPAPEKLQAAKMGISFNGRHFRYREFSYDRLPDAMNYALIDAARGFQATPTRLDADWLPQPMQSEAEKVLMKEFAITIQGNQFQYKGFRYDRLEDAVNYAQLDSARG